VSDKRPLSYPVPWDRVFALTPHIARGTRENIDEFTAAIVRRMDPPPRVEGLEQLPASPRFLLVANHYQRKGLWILHSAAALTQAIRLHYGPGDPPVRWLVTANWPPIRLGPWRMPSPGDWVLPKVAYALHCYPVAFAGADPATTAASLRKVLRDAAHIERPIGLFPEGVAGSAGVLTDPLPGTGRLIAQLARRGLPAVPAGIAEDGRFVLRFGEPVLPEAILRATDPARLLMARVAELIR
jgi:hypothetical protein